MKSFFIFIFCFSLLSGDAQVRLPALVRDSMILQRDAIVRIWGWAAPGEKISIRFNKKTFKTAAGKEGKWTVRMTAMKAGGPYKMEINASNQITLHEVLIGDVWFCSGQSNMVHQMRLHAERYAGEIAQASYPQIRQFWIPALPDVKIEHADLPPGFWKPAISKDLLDFSVVAFFFAKDIYEKYRVPIGLINASVGGAPIEAWTSEDGLKEFPGIVAAIKKNRDTVYLKTSRTVEEVSGKSNTKNEGLTSQPAWFDPAFTPRYWRPINIPGYWEDQGIRDLNGTVWYRREITIPTSMTGKPAKLALGRIVDADVVYINGRKIGNTTYQYPQRRYLLADDILKPGKNLIVVQVSNYAGKGGFVPDKPYYIVAGYDTVDIKGTWDYRVGEVFLPQRNTGEGFSAQNSPAALYNGMVGPVTPYVIKGVLWYQGESNTGNASAYARLLPALIGDWRTKWGQPDMPFLYVQLPNFSEVQYLPSESQWAMLREAQLKTLTVPHTGMAVTIDVGEWNDIHPDRKKEVGDRLALLAKQIAYGEKDIVASGPLYESAGIDSNRIIVSFKNTGTGLSTIDGGELSQFAIAGADKKFIWAKAKIQNDKVIVWSDDIPAPKFVRYAWADNPDNPNLANKEGLLASPFRTDQ
jgi:sialate O-acetylesterase